VEALGALANQHHMPIIVSTHPRTRKRLETLGTAALPPAVQCLKPFGFYDYNRLQTQAFCAISDSGTIAEEASILGFPAITPRDSIERPEGLDVGCVIMTGIDRDTMLASVAAVTQMFIEREAAGIAHPVPGDYCITNTSERVLSLILGTARLSNTWDGIRENDLE
jgi:UDP-N-acetylglucosamine 2-epimerase (non-hydrolysing)